MIAFDIALGGLASLGAILLVFMFGTWALPMAGAMTAFLALGVASLRLRSRRWAMLAAGTRLLLAAAASPYLVPYGSLLLPIWLLPSSVGHKRYWHGKEAGTDEGYFRDSGGLRLPGTACASNALVEFRSLIDADLVGINLTFAHHSGEGMSSCDGRLVRGAAYGRAAICGR